MTERLLLIDGIGPFFRHHASKRINWSKIPFSSLETEDGIKADVLSTVPEDFQKLCERVSQLGYNAITLDDVPHLIQCDAYPASLQRKIEAYRALFRELIEIATSSGLSVFFTMDLMFFNPALDRLLGRRQKDVNAWLAGKISTLFDELPEIGGVIMRFGESDGVDVRGDFRSRLWLKRSRDARRLLEHLLPVFERHRRKLVFRTWAVGAHPIGDLSWNEKRFREVFGGVDSEALIVSMKHGESDFFRYLRVNPLFFSSPHKKVVEFQARREYEGFGAYPSFIGWDSEAKLDQLRDAKNLIGMSVWCQTGGWGKRRQLTFLRNSSVWVELNTSVLAKLWNGLSCEEAIASHVTERLPEVQAEDLSDFLRRSDTVIKDLLYVRELAKRRLYFRRLRLPPQIFVFWDRIMINPMIKKVFACLVHDPDAALREGRLALRDLRTMVELAENRNIPTQGLKLQLATFEIIAAAREYFFDGDEELVKQLPSLKADYKRRFKRHYSVMLDLDESHIHRVPLGWIMPLMLRERRRYRMLDQVLTIRLLGLLYPVAKRFRHRIGPKFAQEQAMGLEVLLK